jgi:hypothetical protein
MQYAHRREPHSDRLVSPGEHGRSEVRSLSLLGITKYKPATVCRGIIMQEEITELLPHPNMTYCSFSECDVTVKKFADPEYWYAFQFKRFPKNYGYIVEYTPQAEEVLFHYKFLDLFPYVQAMAANDIDGSTLHEQKEITILQPSEPFRNIKLFKISNTVNHEQ